MSSGISDLLNIFSGLTMISLVYIGDIHQRITFYIIGGFLVFYGLFSLFIQMRIGCPE